MRQVLVDMALVGVDGVPPYPARLEPSRPLPRGARGKKHAAARSVTINIAESPLGWLRARGMVTARQYEAGERLRADYERASLGPSVTMRWDASPLAKGRRGAPEGGDPTMAQISAKRRFDAALAGLGAGLSDIAWRVICAGETLPLAERRSAGRCAADGWC
jgi:Domain of unknown function (DUF6456)